MEYNFEWDPSKARDNIRKHGITFKQASKVFDDPMAVTIFDDDSSDEEDRWVTLGQVQSRYYLVVVYTYRDSINDITTIRIISARSATKPEIRQYEKGQ